MSDKPLVKTLYYLLKSVRPRQWIKNLAVYCALVFSGFFFYDPINGQPYFLTVTLAFTAFCFLTSSIYLINDVVDQKSDRLHPFKSKRPIASGKISTSLAINVALIGLISALLIAINLGWFFLLLAVAYFVLQILYAFYLKNQPIFDVVSIATGFLIRVYAGAVVVNVHTGVWFLLTIISASLFLAVAKRQSERTLLTNSIEEIGSVRKTLNKYSQRLLDIYTSMFATATWLTYALFAFQHEVSQLDNPFISAYGVLPRSLHLYKLLMLSLPFVIFGVMRYLQLVYEGNRGESPDQVLFNDKPILITAIGFIVTVMLVIYGFS